MVDVIPPDASYPPPTLAQEDLDSLVGAQVVLDPDSKASQGARGAHSHLQLNIDHRDAGYVEMGLDPSDPNGSLSDPDTPASDAARAGGKAKSDAPKAKSA